MKIERKNKDTFRFARKDLPICKPDGPKGPISNLSEGQRHLLTYLGRYILPTIFQSMYSDNINTRINLSRLIRPT